MATCVQDFVQNRNWPR